MSHVPKSLTGHEVHGALQRASSTAASRLTMPFGVMATLTGENTNDMSVCTASAAASARNPLGAELQLEPCGGQGLHDRLRLTAMAFAPALIASSKMPLPRTAIPIVNRSGIRDDRVPVIDIDLVANYAANRSCRGREHGVPSLLTAPQPHIGENPACRCGQLPGSSQPQRRSRPTPCKSSASFP